MESHYCKSQYLHDIKAMFQFVPGVRSMFSGLGSLPYLYSSVIDLFAIFPQLKDECWKIVNFPATIQKKSYSNFRFRFTI